jgi:hypothetical protein
MFVLSTVRHRVPIDQGQQQTPCDVPCKEAVVTTRYELSSGNSRQCSFDGFVSRAIRKHRRDVSAQLWSMSKTYSGSVTLSRYIFLV